MEYKVRPVAANTDDAATEILRQMENNRNYNVFYIDGWDGWGASAALKAAAHRLKSPGSKFDRVLHLDCSLWKSRRALQKAIAEEIKLPHSVMAILSQLDKEEDFNGVEEGARKEVREINTQTYRRLANVNSFAVVFHNGSGSYIDLNEFGVPLNPNLEGNVLLWTFQGRFRPYYKESRITNWKLKVMGDIVSCSLPGNYFRGSGSYIDNSLLWGIVNEEAKEVAQYTGIIDHMVVLSCILYMWKLKGMGDIDWATHASNYWVCDGIIQGGSTEAWAWKVGDALQRNIHLDWSWRHMHQAISSSTAELQMHHLLPRPPVICCPSNITSVPAEATSLFLSNHENEESPSRRVATFGTAIPLPTSVFEHSASSLLVLHLSQCTFRFASPPFLCCSNLRFLLLHRCEDDGTTITPAERKELDRTGAWRACFGNLRVLDLSYTQWCWLLSERMMNIMANLRELNARGIKNWSTSDLRGCGSLVKLRVEDSNATDDPPSSVDGQRLILENSVALEQAVLINDAPSGDENACATVDRICNISFRGCAQLRSILLRGLFGCLNELDLSCTAVETLDLRKVQARRLKRLILLGCQKLRAILWPPRPLFIQQGTLDVFRVSTTPSTSSGQEWPHLCKWEEQREEVNSASTAGPSSSLDRDWYISVRDARLLRSLEVFRTSHNDRYSIGRPTRVEIPSPPASGDSVTAQGVSTLSQHVHDVAAIYARDTITRDQLIQDEDAAVDDEDGQGTIRWMWDCPTTQTMHGHGWYIHVQAEDDEQEGQGGEAQDDGTWTPPHGFICDTANVVHVHDCLSITSGVTLSFHVPWNKLHWCRVERCPMLRSVFTTYQDENFHISMFPYLTTFWASRLPMAKYIWNWSPRAYLQAGSFKQLQFLHLDYCPRVILVLPLYSHMSLPQLETLEIICCGDLREIFRTEDPKLENQEEAVKHFPKLRRIHLHNLSSLHLRPHDVFTNARDYQRHRLPSTQTFAGRRRPCRGGVREGLVGRPRVGWVEGQA